MLFHIFYLYIPDNHFVIKSFIYAVQNGSDQLERASGQSGNCCYADYFSATNRATATAVFHRAVVHSAVFHRDIFHRAVVHRAVFHRDIFHRAVFQRVVVHLAVVNRAIISRQISRWVEIRSLSVKFLNYSCLCFITISTIYYNVNIL